jgi:hypothetical protein
MSRNDDLLCADELRFDLRLGVLKQHLNHLLKILAKFIKGRALGVRPRKTWDMADVQPPIAIPLDHRSIDFHQLTFQACCVQ